jgi:hypothetical protein
MISHSVDAVFDVVGCSLYPNIHPLLYDYLLTILPLYRYQNVVLLLFSWMIYAIRDPLL